MKRDVSDDRTKRIFEFVMKRPGKLKQIFKVGVLFMSSTDREATAAHP
jgi:hypothetical protein